MTVCNEISKLQLRYTKVLSFGFGIMLLFLALTSSTLAQENNQMVRFAKITVDPLQLVEYTTALKEQMVTAVRARCLIVSCSCR
jgi:aromatic ring-opening dioxygenase LigB subunit